MRAVVGLLLQQADEVFFGCGHARTLAPADGEYQSRRDLAHCGNVAETHAIAPKGERWGGTMRGLIGWLAASVAGYAGWWLGSKNGFATGVMASVLAAGFGMYAAYRWFDQNLK